MTDTAEARRQLETRLAELEGRLARLERDLAEPADPDSSDRAIQQEDDAGLEAESAVVSSDIASVRRALQRIETGTYGDCVRCGQPIAEGRLAARPEAALCITCAEAEGS